MEELEKRKTFREQGIPFRDDHQLQQLAMLPEAL
jgi:hypothetical protein